MFWRFQGFIIIMIFAVFVISGCFQETGDNPELDNQALRTRVSELELIIAEQSAQIEQYKTVYDLRNILDIKARQILSALNSGVFGEIEADLLNENGVIEEDRLVFSFDNYKNEVFFFQNRLDFERVRQRSYHLDEQGRFVASYEIASLSDGIQERIDNRAVLNFTFIERPSGWKLADIGTDR